MRIQGVVKRACICGVSLLAVMSLGTGSISAKQRGHNPVRVQRESRVRSYRYFHRLMTRLYRCYSIGYYTRRGRFIFSRAGRRINRYYQRHFHQFSHRQLRYLVRSGFYGDLTVRNRRLLRQSFNGNSRSLFRRHRGKNNATKRAPQYYYHHGQRIYDIGISSRYDLKGFERQGNAELDEFQQDLIKDINQSRIADGKKPLTVTDALQATANYRAPRVQYAYEHYNDYLKYPHHTSNPSDNWVHGADTHTSGWDNLHARHYYPSYWGANAGEASPRYTNQDDGARFKYNNSTIDGIAANFNDELLNHDETGGNNDGHRFIELSPHYHYLGVAVTYSNPLQAYSINEQYAS